MKLNPHLPKIIEALRENEGHSHPRDIRGAVDELEHMARRIDALEELAERLTAERDEARREVCQWEHHWDKTSSEQYYADKRGWDCFKEDGK
jgi:hypothetical protein